MPGSFSIIHKNHMDFGLPGMLYRASDLQSGVF